MSEPSKSSGTVDSLVGTVKDNVGAATGSTSLANEGKEQHAKGEGEVKAAEAKNYVDGTIQAATGFVNNVLGAVTGDKKQQASGVADKETGKAKQEANS